MTDRRLESSIFGDHDSDPDDLDPDDAGQGSGADGRGFRDDAAGIGTGGGRRASTRSGEGRGHRGKPALWRRLLVISIALVIVVVSSVVALGVLRPLFDGGPTEPIDFAGPGTSAVRFRVTAGAGGSTIGKALADQGIIKTQQAFVEAASADERSSGIQPGIYALKKQMTAADALAVLVEPDNRLIWKVTIPEGLWASEIYPRLAKATGLPVAQYTVAAKNASALGLPPSARGNIEGYLFPASYTFDQGTSATAQLKTMVGESTKRLRALGIKPENMERVVIVASLVEGEANTDADRGKVARVVENRLAQGEILGFDSTVNYIFRRRGVPTQEMLASESQYNTRKFGGLPPGPIANAGESALKAAANPTPGPWIYFVTVNLDTGETRFESDPEAHQRNVEAFNEWCAANQGKC